MLVSLENYKPQHLIAGLERSATGIIKTASKIINFVGQANSLFTVSFLTAYGMENYIVCKAIGSAFLLYHVAKYIYISGVTFSSSPENIEMLMTRVSTKLEELEKLPYYSPHTNIEKKKGRIDFLFSKIDKNIVKLSKSWSPKSLKEIERQEERKLFEVKLKMLQNKLPSLKKRYKIIVNCPHLKCEDYENKPHIG